MPSFSVEEWRAAQRVQKTKRNLQVRVRRLLHLLRKNRTWFRQDETTQLELRRVARLSVKLGVHLNSALEDEVVARVMES